MLNKKLRPNIQPASKNFYLKIFSCFFWGGMGEEGGVILDSFNNLKTLYGAFRLQRFHPNLDK